MQNMNAFDLDETQRPLHRKMLQMICRNYLPGIISRRNQLQYFFEQ